MAEKNTALKTQNPMLGHSERHNTILFQTMMVYCLRTGGPPDHILQEVGLCGRLRKISSTLHIADFC